MLEDTIEELTKQMIEEFCKSKQEGKTKYAKITKVDLYKFCIKLIKLIKRIEENYK